MGFITDIFSGGGTGKYDEAAELFAGLEVPDAEQAIRELAALEASRQTRPEGYQAALQSPTRLSTYSADPRLRDAQLRALGELESLGSEGGLRAVDRARLADIESENPRAARGAREAVMQNAAARGVRGSGLELVDQMVANQAAAQRSAQQGQDVAARAEQRALDAILSGGQLGGDIRGQDFREQERIAAAEDAINQFNAANQTDANRFGADWRNKAQQENTNRAYENFWKSQDLRQNQFGNELAKTEGQTGALTGAGDLEEERRKSGAGLVSGGIGAFRTAFGG